MCYDTTIDAYGHASFALLRLTQGGLRVKRVGLWSLGVLGLIFAILFGRWSQSLFTVSELMHFSVNFPSEGRAEVMSCCDVGGPWARSRDPSWCDYSPGGLLAYGEEGALVVDVGRQGIIKRLVQPDFESISSHWLRNVGTRPYRIRMEMDLSDLDLEWETFEAAWDPVSKTSTRAIEPGDTFNMDWFFHIPCDMRNRSVISSGTLSIYDAETDLLLSELPIEIVNSRATQETGG